MYYLRKLPLLFALTAAILLGVLGLSCSMSNKRILTIMIISMVIFFAVGIYVRASIFSIIEQVNEKKKKNSEEEEQKVQVGQERQSETIKGKDQHTEDDFEPLRVTDYIKNELKQS
jgi:hypothetical protein